MSKNHQHPEDNPFACNGCGTYLSESKRIAGEEHCDACLRDAGFEPRRPTTGTEQESDQ